MITMNRKHLKQFNMTVSDAVDQFLRRQASKDGYMSRQEYVRHLIQREMEKERQEAFDAAHH